MNSTKKFYLLLVMNRQKLFHQHRYHVVKNNFYKTYKKRNLESKKWGMKN